MVSHLSSLKLKDAPDRVSSDLLSAWHILHRLAPIFRYENPNSDILLFLSFYHSALDSCEDAFFQYLRLHGYEQEL